MMSLDTAPTGASRPGAEGHGFLIPVCDSEELGGMPCSPHMRMESLVAALAESPQVAELV